MQQIADEHVLIAGATGLVGRAAMQHFAERGYRTTAVSRRPPFSTYGADFVSVDLADAAACERAFSALTDVTRVVFAALHEEEDLVAGWLQDAHIRRNGDMLRNMLEPLSRASRSLRHVTILQGPKAYGVHVKPIRSDSREGRDDMRELPNFYWVQQDYLEAKGRAAGWSWTVLRPALVVGEAIGGAMNLIAALGAYGAILKARGEPLHYPGLAANVLEATDTDLMAGGIEWAGTAPAAANRVFNITNGEVFALKDYWPTVADALGMTVGEDRPQKLLDTMSGCAAEWDAIRRAHNLEAPDLARFIGQSWQFADFVFAGRAVSTPGLVSTVAIRQAGFGEAMYTDDMLTKWFARYQADRLLPPR